MRLRFTVVVILAAWALGGTASADDARDRDPLSTIEPQTLFQGLIRERDVTLVFDYLRLAAAAVVAGREAPPPEELRKRAGKLGEEIRMRGALAGLVLLSALEENAKRMVREGMARPARPKLPPTVPYMPAASDD